MASLRFAVLLAASFFGVLLLAASASAASGPSSRRRPAVYGVGDKLRAAAPASNAGTHRRHHQTLRKWATRHRFYVGDVLDFKRSNDSVLLVRHGDYERCSSASPLRRFADGGNHTRFTLAHPGLFYFISGARARCETGQRMVLRVRCFVGGDGALTPAPAPAPPPGTMEPSNPTDSPSDDWVKLIPPALTGFLAGSLLAGVIIVLAVDEFAPPPH